MPGSQQAPSPILSCPISSKEMGFFIRFERRRKNNYNNGWVLAMDGARRLFSSGVNFIWEGA